MGLSSPSFAVNQKNRALQRKGSKSFLSKYNQKRTVRQRSYSGKNWRESYRKTHVMPWQTKGLLLLMAVCSIALFMIVVNWLN